MGREIFYCWKCAIRLETADFERRKAFRHQDKISCDECVFELVGDLSAEEQERILAGENPEAAAPRPRKSGTGTIKRMDPEGLGSPGTRSTGMRKRTGQTGPIPKTTGPTKRMTRPIPKVEPGEEIAEGEESAEAAGDPAAKKKKILLISGIAGGAALLLVLAIVVMSGGKKKPVVPVAGAGNTPAAVVKAPAANEPGQAAKTAHLEVVAFQKSNPEAWGALITKWRELEQLAKGTELAGEASYAIEGTLSRMEKALASFDEQIKPQKEAEEFKAVLDALAAELPKHDLPEWKAAMTRKIDQYNSIIEEKWRGLKAKAEEARANNETGELEKLAAQVTKWGIPKYSELLAKIAATAPAEPEPAVRPAAAPAARAGAKAPSVKPVFSKPLSADMQAFWPGWQKAAGLAFNRDFEKAASQLSDAARPFDSDEIRKAAAEDLEAIRDAGKFLMTELFKAADGIKRLSTVKVEYLQAPGVWREETGRAERVEDSRLELKVTITDEKTKKTREELRLIEFTDLSADTLGGLYKAAKKTLDKKESLAIAHLCFLEGDLDAGRAFAGNQVVSERFLVWSGEAREAAPKGSSQEFEARNLFHQHELEWRKMETWGPAMEKAKTLLSDYPAARIVRSHQPLLTKRSSIGKEYVFLPSDLKALGDSNTFKFKKDELVWVTSKDIDFNESLYNHVDVDFYALPNTAYRAWIYVGGCCQPVFGALYQTTEGVISHKGKEQAINPGENVAPPIPMTSNLKKTHDEHKPKGAKEHPKTPAKWAWISLPLPRQYASPGPKKIRLLTDQAGFGIKYVIVSSTRTSMPDAAGLKELDAQAQTAFTEAPAGSLGPKGAPQPKEWLVVGPFESKLGQAEEPETNIDLKKDIKGKGGNVKWKRFDAAIGGANAVLDWAKSKIYTPVDNTAAYALIHVKVPQAVDGLLILTHDDGGKAWVNGTKVHENDRGGGFKADEFKVKIKLEAGWNRLLFKVRNGGGGSMGLQMRVVDGVGSPIPGIEWHAYGDVLAP